MVGPAFILISLWVAIGLFYWQYRECCAVQKRERKLEKKNAEMTCFVYGAAHDLKAPLRAIMQISERLTAELQPVIQDNHREDFLLLQQRARRMSTLIDDLLAYWQAGQSVEYTHNYTVDIYALTQDVITLLAPPPTFTFIIDPQLKRMIVRCMPMRQVMMNLIGNAIKHHGKRQGIIRINGADAGDFYTISVADDGQGVPAEYKQKIFEPFETLQSRDDVEGSGLGLSLVKRIVEKQRASIHVADAPGGGAVFHFTWPKKRRG
jgi:signal transduction histidine kinase